MEACEGDSVSGGRVNTLLQLQLCWLCFSRELKLKRPMYQCTAAYGHFGREDFSWEVPKKLKY